MLDVLIKIGKILIVIVILLVIAAIVSLIWQAYDNLYDITLHTGLGSDTRVKRLYRSMESLPTWEVDCYEFRGYYTEPDGYGTQITDEDGDILERPKKNADIYSYYVPIEFTVKVLDENGEEVDTHTIVYGDDITSFVDGFSTRENYDLVYTLEWNYLPGTNKAEIGRNGTIDERYATFKPRTYHGNATWGPDEYNLNLTIHVGYAPKAHTINVIFPGTYMGKSVEYTNQTSLYLIEAYNIPGKTFVGYATFAEAGLDDIIPRGTIYTFETVTVYAIYRDTVTIDFDGASQSYYDGQKITLPEPETVPAGCEYAGWEFTDKSFGANVYTELDLTTDYNGAVMIPAWRNASYKITYYSGKDKLNEENYSYGTSKTISYTCSKTFHTFDGWYLNENFTGGKVTEITPETYGELTLYAHFTPKDYTVLLDPVGGNVSSYEKTITYGSSSFTIPVPTRTGREFVGWYYIGPAGEKVFVTDAAGASKFPFDTRYLVGKSTEYALSSLNLLAEYAVLGYNVSFTVFGEVYERDTVEHGQPISPPSNPDVKGYTFVRWLDAEGEEFDFDTRITADTTLTAELTAKTYTIVLKVRNNEGYIANGGDEYTEVRINYTYGDTTLDLSDIVPIRDGYDFSGWYSVSRPCIFPDGTVMLNNLKQVLNDNGETILYANWV